VFKVPEKYRLKLDPKNNLHTTAKNGNNGLFLITNNKGVKLYAIASDDLGWEHVSITVKNKKRCPKWDEMCFIKAIFWGPSDSVVQYHPPQKENVSFHDTCLHLWRPIEGVFPSPPAMLVGG